MQRVVIVLSHYLYIMLENIYEKYINKIYYMFVKFNYDNFPNIYVTFGKLNSTKEFNILTSEWLRLC